MFYDNRRDRNLEASKRRPFTRNRDQDDPEYQKKGALVIIVQNDAWTTMKANLVLRSFAICVWANSHATNVSNRAQVLTE